MLEASMRKNLTIICSLIISVVTLLTGSLAIAWDKDDLNATMSKSIEKACHRAVKKATPLGYRGLETVSYIQQMPSAGMAEGRVMAKFGQDDWVDVAWTCNIHPRSKRIFNLEVKEDRRRRNVFS